MLDSTKIEKAIKDLLDAIGEDTNREGLRETPRRVAKMYEEIYAGLNEDPNQHVKLFENAGNNLVVVKDITFYSMCEHHLMPFYGKAAIAYIPKEGKVLGLSKVARIIDTFAKKPQIQEHLGNEICDFLYTNLNAQGVMVILKAEHLCMTMRGIKKPDSKTVTISTRGCFETDEKKRREVIATLKI